MKKRTLGPCVTFFPQPTTIISSLSDNGEANLMTASWVGIVSKTPPTIAVSLNKERKTYLNIKQTSEFVVNMVPSSLALEADYCGIRSGHSENKLDQTSLSLEPADQIAAPMLVESPLNLECRLVREIELGDYRLLLGEIVEIHATEAAFSVEGEIETKAFDPLVYLGGIRQYWSLGEKCADAYKDGLQIVKKK
jgi:flavin reductase (DIM6/NTAB) family NADH-FMN oxidoreductase RutF